jgi:hypothetical protein
MAGGMLCHRFRGSRHHDLAALIAAMARLDKVKTRETQLREERQLAFNLLFYYFCYQAPYPK